MDCMVKHSLAPFMSSFNMSLSPPLCRGWHEQHCEFLWLRPVKYTACICRHQMSLSTQELFLCPRFITCCCHVKVFWCVSRLSGRGGPQEVLSLWAQRPVDVLVPEGQPITPAGLMSTLTLLQRPSMWQTVSNEHFSDSFTLSLQALINLCVFRCGGSGGPDLWGVGMCCGRFD